MGAIRLAKCSFSKFHKGHIRIVRFELFIETDPRTSEHPHSWRLTSKISIKWKFLHYFWKLVRKLSVQRLAVELFPCGPSSQGNDDFQIWFFQSLKVKSPVLSIVPFFLPFLWEAVAGAVTSCKTTLAYRWQTQAGAGVDHVALFLYTCVVSRPRVHSAATEHHKKTKSFTRDGEAEVT